MNRFALALLLLSAPVFAQSTARPRSFSHRVRSTAVGRKPAILGAEYYSLLPHIVDGGQLTTQIVMTNLGSVSEDWEVDFYTDNNQNLQFNINGVGITTSISGTLAPGQSQVFSTSGTTAATTVDGWGFVNDASGFDISAYAIIRNTVPLYNFAAESTLVSNIGMYQAGSNLAFDNTNGYLTTIAFTNPDNLTDVLDAIVYDSNGNQIGIHQISLGAGQKTLFAMNAQWTETTNIAGSIHFYPDDPAIQLCQVTPAAFRLLILPNSQTFVTLPLLESY